MTKRKLNSISHILFYKQPITIEGTKTTCFSLAQILATLTLCGILLAAVIVYAAAAAHRYSATTTTTAPTSVETTHDHT